MNVELLSHFGNDTMVADVARVSFNKQADRYTVEQNDKLLAFLMKHKHTSPFRHPQLQFRVTCPIYVERQLFKHAVGISVNSISGRYVDFSDTYYKMKNWRKQSKSSKQGSEGLLDGESAIAAMKIEDEIIANAKKAYNDLIALGVSKEQARSVLPLSLNTTFIWTGSLLAFMHMCDLRLKKDAQEETRRVVEMMLEDVKNIYGNPFKMSLQLLDMKLAANNVDAVCG